MDKTSSPDHLFNVEVVSSISRKGGGHHHDKRYKRKVKGFHVEQGLRDRNTDMQTTIISEVNKISTCRWSYSAPKSSGHHPVSCRPCIALFQATVQRTGHDALNERRQDVRTLTSQNQMAT